MWIEIKPSVFIPENILELRKLIQDLTYKYRYNIFIDIVGLSENEILRSHIYNDNQEVIEEFYSRFINDSQSIDIIVENVPTNDNSYSLSEAIIYANLQVQIVLENSDNDGNFLDAIIREFKNKSRKIQRAKDELWLRYTNAGGSGNLIHLINREIANCGGNLKFLKIFVLVDSDLELPLATNNRRLALVDFLNAYDIPYHILEKREIENYLPDNQLENINTGNVFIRTYVDELTSRQKDYLDIERGFNMDSSALKRNKREVYDFYLNDNENESQSNAKINNLRFGIRNQFDNFKNEYSELFRVSTQKGLLKRTEDQESPNELSEILEKISELL